MFLLLACAQAPESVTTDAYNDVGDSYIEFELQVLQNPVGLNLTSDCDDQDDFNDGLTLTPVPANEEILVSAIDIDGNLLYEEIVNSDACGTATPFVNVTVEDFGGPMDDYAFGVFAQVASDPSFYEYTGVFIEETSSLPISTQWYYDEERGGWYAYRNEERGVMIGNFMIP
jgi:hypothetical protein